MLRIVLCNNVRVCAGANLTEPSFSSKLVDRLEGMRQCRLGNGETECILCGETFRFYHRSQRRCAECKKMTCAKCGSESVVKTSGSTVYIGFCDQPPSEGSGSLNPKEVAKSSAFQLNITTRWS